MSSFKQAWFNTSGRSVLPRLTKTSPMVAKLFARGLALAVLAAFVPSAFAGDLDIIPPSYAPPPPPSKKLLCYAGVLGEVVVSHPSFDNVPLNGVYSEYFASGGRGGGIAGCEVLFQSGAFLGAEFTAAYGSLKGRHAVGYEGNAPFEMAARIRFGFMLDPDVAVFVTGGPSDTYFTSKDAAGVTTSGFNTGGQISTGFEVRFLSTFRARGEYVYTWPGSDSTLITACLPLACQANGAPFARINPTSHAVRIAIMRVFGQ
jgi:hypothetical protein